MVINTIGRNFSLECFFVVVVAVQSFIPIDISTVWSCDIFSLRCVYARECMLMSFSLWSHCIPFVLCFVFWKGQKNEEPIQLRNSCESWAKWIKNVYRLTESVVHSNAYVGIIHYSKKLFSLSPPCCMSVCVLLLCVMAIFFCTFIAYMCSNHFCIQLPFCFNFFLSSLFWHRISFF